MVKKDDIGMESHPPDNSDDKLSENDFDQKFLFTKIIKKREIKY